MKARMDRAGEMLCDGVLRVLVLIIAALPWIVGAVLVISAVAALISLGRGFFEVVKRLVEWVF